MIYRIGFDGVASAEITHMLRAVQNALNGSGANLLMRVRAEEAASVASAPCVKYTKECENGKAPTEPPNIVVLVLIVVVSLTVGFAVGYRFGKKAATTPA